MNGSEKIVRRREAQCWLTLMAWAWHGARLDPLLLLSNAGNSVEFAQGFLKPNFHDWRAYVDEIAVTLHMALWGTVLAVVVTPRDALAMALQGIARFGAQALVVSLGMDTFEGDPISGFTLQSADYLHVGADLARAGRQGRREAGRSHPGSVPAGRAGRGLPGAGHPRRPLAHGLRRALAAHAARAPHSEDHTEAR